jgi:hypothetical protein
VARFIDELRRDKKNADALSGLYVVNAENVCEYLERTKQFNIWDPQKLPVVTPPFKRFWMEYSVPGMKNTNVGTLLLSDQFNREDHGVRWLTKATMFLRVYGQMVYPGHFLFEISPNGKLLGIADHLRLDKEVKDDISLGMANVILWTLCFMNTQKVERIETVPPEKLSRSHQKKYGVPMSRFYTLKVTAMNERSSRVHHGGEHNSPAHHIVRGHFRQFSLNKPLFGKWSGVYWWNEFERGDRKRGEVTKEYEVVPPMVEAEGGEA